MCLFESNPFKSIAGDVKYIESDAKPHIEVQNLNEKFKSSLEIDNEMQIENNYKNPNHIIVSDSNKSDLNIIEKEIVDLKEIEKDTCNDLLNNEITIDVNRNNSNEHLMEIPMLNSTIDMSSNNKFNVLDIIHNF